MTTIGIVFRPLILHKLKLLSSIVFLSRLDGCFAPTCAFSDSNMGGEATVQLMSHGLGMGAQAILNRLKRELKIKNEILMNAS